MRLIRLLLAVAVALASTAFVLGATSSAAATGTFNPPSSIATDCSVDVSVQLKDFLASVPNGATIQLAPEGCYLMQREILVSSKAGWTLDGRGATLRRSELSPPELQYPNYNAMLRFGDLTDSTITNLKIVGINTVSDIAGATNLGAYKPQFAFEHGIVLSGAQNVTLENTRIDAMFGDGVYIGGTKGRPQAKNVTLRNVSVERNGRQGIAITSANGILIDGVVIAHSRRAGIDLEPHRDKTIENVEIRNSQIGSRLLAVSGAGLGMIKAMNIHHNQFLRSALPVVLSRGSGLDRRDAWRVADNEIMFTVRSSAAALTFSNTEGVLVEGNKFKLSLGSGLVLSLGDHSQALVRCNLLTGAHPDYVKSDATSSFVVDSNSLTAEAPDCSVATPDLPPVTAVPPPIVKPTTSVTVTPTKPTLPAPTTAAPTTTKPVPATTTTKPAPTTTKSVPATTTTKPAPTTAAPTTTTTTKQSTAAAKAAAAKRHKRLQKAKATCNKLPGVKSTKACKKVISTCKQSTAKKCRAAKKAAIPRCRAALGYGSWHKCKKAITSVHGQTIRALRAKVVVASQDVRAATSTRPTGSSTSLPTSSLAIVAIIWALFGTVARRIVRTPVRRR